MSGELTALVSQSFNAPDLTANQVQVPNYVGSMFDGAATRGINTNLGLPGYSYYQGLVVGHGKVDVVGQIRVVGGILASSDAHLQGGAMVTTTPDAQLGRVNSVRSRWQVESWTEE